MAIGFDPRIGSTFLGYRVEEAIGRGGMGVVYRAYDPRLKRNVALKLLAPELASDERFRERFLSETELAASLEHPNVVPIHDAGELDGQLYIVMRYVEGADLGRLLVDEGPLEPEKALAVCSQVANALDAAHERGLVHRDVKPSNVLVDGRGHAYLTDFGLSRRLTDEAAGVGSEASLGTPAYVSPEQVRGKEMDGRSDQYSLACVLYECLGGNPPFPRPSEAATLFAHLEEAPPALPRLEGVFARALAKDPDKRYRSCADLIAAARQALGIEEPAPRRRSHLAIAVALVLCGVTLASALLARGSSGPEPLPDADALIRIDPSKNTVAETIPVGREASAVAAARGYVWVTNTADGTIWRVDVDSGDALRIAARGSPTGIAARGDAAIAVDGAAHHATVLDSTTAATEYDPTLLGGGNGHLRVAAGREGVWVADPGSRSVARLIEPLEIGAPVEPVRIPPDETSILTTYESFDDLAVGAGGVWVAGDAFGRTVWRVDPTSGRVAAAIPVPFVPKGIAAGAEGVWVTSLLDDTVARIDPRTNRITDTIRVGRGVDAVAVGNGSVWVASTLDRIVSRIDPAAGEVVEEIPIAGAPRDIAASEDGVWVVADTEPVVMAEEGTIAIGILTDCTGQFGGLRDLTLGGAQLPLLQRGGALIDGSLTDGVEGVSIGARPVRLYAGCGDGKATSALVEARRLVEQVGVDVLIGPLAGSQEAALQAYARRHPATTFVNGTASAHLGDPAPNFFSFHPTGAQWMAGLGRYAYHDLGWRTAVTVGGSTTDIFTWSQMAGFAAEFCALGGRISERVWLRPGDPSAVLAQVPRADVDGFVVAASPEVVLALVNGSPALRGNLSRRLILGTTAVLPELSALGERTRGVAFAVGGGVPLPTAAGYKEALRSAFPGLGGYKTGGLFDVFYYDAMIATLSALDAVGGDLSDGQRRLRAALAGLALALPNGRTTLDSEHQAIAPNHLQQLTGRGIRSRVIRTIPAVERTFGGLLDGIVPSAKTPVCRKGDPPPWARG